MRAGSTVVGGVVGAVGLGAPLALGAAGFTATGVLGGSVAAGIHSSIGIVGLGSLFAWRQSVGAGGAALTSLLQIGWTGASLAVAGTLSGVLDSKKTAAVADALREKFLEIWKTCWGSL